MPSGRPPVTVHAKEASRLAGMHIATFHKTWREIPAIREAAVESPSGEGGRRQFVRTKLIAFGAARGIVGGNPYRIAFDEDDRMSRITTAFAVLIEELAEERPVCTGCRRMAEMAKAGQDPCCRCGQPRLSGQEAGAA